MSRIIAYNVLSKGSTYQLVQEVNKAIADGWTPLGAVVMCYDAVQSRSDLVYNQTMLKYETPGS